MLGLPRDAADGDEGARGDGDEDGREGVFDFEALTGSRERERERSAAAGVAAAEGVDGVVGAADGEVAEEAEVGVYPEGCF